MGISNNPSKEVAVELNRAARYGFAFVELAAVPPKACWSEIQVKDVRQMLLELKLRVVGQTADYLPFASAFSSLRRAAIEEAKGCIDFFSKIGGEWVTVHPHVHTPFYGPDYILSQNTAAFAELSGFAQERNLGLLVENVPDVFNNSAQIAGLLESVSELGLNLDLGTCILGEGCNTALDIISRFGKRIRHVQVHDTKRNHGDLHLPLGTGDMDFVSPLRELQRCGFTGFITLDIDCSDPEYLLYSRDYLRKLLEQSTEGASRKASIQNPSCRSPALDFPVAQPRRKA